MKPKDQLRDVILLQNGGVDPSILRELSGIYKPFFKAFKELVSNAYDADASTVRIRLNDDCSSIEIEDDGTGMTLFEFKNDFTRLGGSLKKMANGLTPRGRPRIGSKGIGFLAVARYCSAMEIISTTLKKHRGRIQRKRYANRVNIADALEVPIPSRLFSSRLKISSVTVLKGRKSKKLRPADFKLLPNGILQLRARSKNAQSDTLEIGYCLDCRTLEFKAIIDYDYLLSLENKKDLSRLSDFCRVEVRELEAQDSRVKQQYTKIKLLGLKRFVVRDLKSPRRAGRVRNLDSECGIDRFLWHLSRATPVQYQTVESSEKLGTINFDSPQINAIDRVVFSGPSYEGRELRRPLWRRESGKVHTNESFLPVTINEDGLKAVGYIVGHDEAIFPAEYRGIAVRVRNVQIGNPGFFGLGRRVSGPTKAMLSQLTGEINVLEGLDATDALNPGRDSFYEENQHYKILRQQLVGDDEGSNGLVGSLIERMLKRLEVRTAVERELLRADNHRAALLNLSMAINHYGTNFDGKIPLKEFFAGSANVANGLSYRSDHELYPGPRVAGFRVKTQPELKQEHFIDFETQTVFFNYQHDRWSNRIFILEHHYEVIPKDGSDTEPLCEIDTVAKRIYVNWGHSLRQQMGDVAFLKSSVAWKLAYHTCRENVETMMDLALKLWIFNGT